MQFIWVFFINRQPFNPQHADVFLEISMFENICNGNSQAYISRNKLRSGSVIDPFDRKFSQQQKILGACFAVRLAVQEIYALKARSEFRRFRTYTVRKSLAKG